MKKLIVTLIPVLVAILSVACLYDCLVNYLPHADNGSSMMVIAALLCGVNVIFVACAARGKNRAALISGAISLFVCLGVYVIANKIPDCPMCEGMTNEDLGLLSHWIKSDL